MLHALLLALALVACVFDVRSSSIFGSGLGYGLAVPVVGLVLGVAHLGRGRPGGRALLVVADLAVIVVALIALIAIVASSGALSSSRSAIPAVVVGTFAAVALLATLTTARRDVPASVHRTVAHRVAMVVLFASRSSA